MQYIHNTEYLAKHCHFFNTMKIQVSGRELNVEKQQVFS